MRRIRREPNATVLIFGLVVGMGVCAPLLGGKRVFLLDWSIGPHTGLVTSGALGLNGGLTTGVPASWALALLNDLLGGAVTWVPMLVFFPVAMLGAGRLAGGSRCSRLAAGTLYAVNPFVFDRLYVGHLPLLLGYALLPYATAAAIRSLRQPLSLWPIPALWWAILTALSPHFAWIYGVVVLGALCVAIVTRRQSGRRLLAWLVTEVAAIALMSSYILFPNTESELSTQAGATSLAIYRTSGDPHFGLFGNVLGLYGFWRIGPRLPKDVVSGWTLLLLAILVVVGLGVFVALRTRPPQVGAPYANASEKTPGSQDDRQPLALLLLFMAVMGFFLALGDQGPTGGLFLWAYDHVPFFAIMREPEKFLMLLALAYAVFFGWGVERLSQVDISSRRAGATVTALLVGVVLPLGYTPTIFDGLDGQIAPSTLPPAYQQADALMGSGPGNILYLPWHLYMEYPFTDGRVVNNLGPTAFRRNVIAGDNVQADDVETQSTSPRSAYLTKLFAIGNGFDAFGALVAPLGVEYVVLTKTIDWASYSWLNHQSDLKLVLNTTALEVWRNTAYLGVGRRVTTLKAVRDLNGVVNLANAGALGAGAVVTTGSGASSESAKAVASPDFSYSASAAAVHQISPVAYQVPPGHPGWVTVDAVFQPGWTLNGRAARATAEGTVLVRVGEGGGVVQFTPWGRVRLGYLVSSGTFVALLVAVLVGGRRRQQSADLNGDVDEIS